MTSPTEIPEALKAKAREEVDRIIDLYLHLTFVVDYFEREIFAHYVAKFALQVRNEAIAEERRACAELAQDDDGFYTTWGQDGNTAVAQTTAHAIAAAIRARP